MRWQRYILEWEVRVGDLAERPAGQVQIATLLPAKNAPPIMYGSGEEAPCGQSVNPQVSEVYVTLVVAVHFEELAGLVL